jgi:hypothetical protein
LTQGNDTTRVPSPWQQAEAEFGCAHSQRVLRVKTLSNGSVQYRRQCTNCGNGGLAVKKDDAAREVRLRDIPPYDENNEGEWYARQRLRADELRGQQSEAWFAEHSAYTQTSVWYRRRDYVLSRDNYRCQAFLPGCTRKAEQVHHLSYSHWKNEPLFDLVAVCTFCHDEITRMDRERNGRAIV